MLRKIIIMMTLSGVFLLSACTSDTLNISTTDQNTATSSGAQPIDMRGQGIPNMDNLTDEQKTEFEAMRAIMDKQRNGETLTEEEQAKLEEMEANRPQMQEGMTPPEMQ